MKVFISWSGIKSRRAAQILSEWIARIIVSAETWISDDIEKGSRWNERLNKELEEAKIGIICLERHNLSARYILFEAGALSKTSDAHVCTFLLDVYPDDIEPPLRQFQHTLFTMEDIKRLFNTINKKAISQGEKGLSEKNLDKNFETFWPEIEQELKAVVKLPSEKGKASRTERELLEELLREVRGKLVFTDKDKSTASAFPSYEEMPADLKGPHYAEFYSTTLQKIKEFAQFTSPRNTDGSKG